MREFLTTSALLMILSAVLWQSAPGPDATLVGEVTSVHSSDRLVAGDDEFIRIEARANTFTASKQSDATLAFAPDGGLLLAWQSRRQDDGRHGVFSQRFNPIGRRIGVETRLGSVVAAHRTAPAVAIDRDGAALAMWEAFGLDGDLNGVFLQPTDQEVPGNSLTAGPQRQISLVAGADGQWIGAWTGPGSVADPTLRVWIRRFGADGQPLGPEQRVSGGSHAEGPASLAAWPDGSFVVTWATQHADGRPAGLTARRFAADGQPTHQPITVNQRNDVGSLEPSVAAIPGDGFVVAWMDNRGSDHYDVVARRFDRRGAPVTDTFTVSEAGGLEQTGAAVAVAPDGRCCVAWTQRADNGDYDVRARFADLDGDRLGPAFQITRARSGDQTLLSGSGRRCLTFGPHGQLALSWSGSSELGDHSAAHLTLLLPDRSAVRGDLNGDAEVDARDLRTLFDVLTRRDLDPRHHAAADLNRDGEVNRADVEAFAWSEQDGSVRRAGFAALSARARVLDDAQRWLNRIHGHEDHGEAAAGGPAVVTEAALPHDPPVRTDRPTPTLPNGGDRFPVAKAELGFIGVTNTGWSPPDPHMAMGPNHSVSMTNGAIAFHDRGGNRLFQDEIEGRNGFWGSLGATGFVFDPEVIWDPHSSRFMAMACERTNSSGSGLSFFLLAISDDADPNGTWFKYRLNVTGPGNGGDIDSPNLGVDQDAIYLTADFFTGGQKYLIHILEKAPLLSGNPVGTVRNLLIQGAQSHGIPVMFGTAKAMYLIEHFESSSNSQVRLHAITSPLTNPQRVTFRLSVPAYGRPGSLPQMGSSVRQSTFDARFWSCVWRDGSLWAAHHHGSNPVRARWYEIKTNGWPGTGLSPTLAQAADVNLPRNVHGAFNSISVDADGNALMTFARSSTTEFISAARAYRLASDAPSKMRAAQIVKGSTGPYSGSRWGDYSQASPDPVDPCTIWFTHEYSPVAGSWNTWISRTQMCSLSADVTELSAANGGVANFTLFNPEGAGNLYVLLGSLSGIEPGTRVGPLRIPLNFDPFTNLVISAANSPVFASFAGTLDPSGRASARLTVPNLAGGAGLTMNYAFVEFGTTWEFASNAIALRIVQ